MAVGKDRSFPLATTGCRRGEAIGLCWRDVNLDTARISIRCAHGNRASDRAGRATPSNRPGQHIGQSAIRLEPHWNHPLHLDASRWRLQPADQHQRGKFRVSEERVLALPQHSDFQVRGLLECFSSMSLALSRPALAAPSTRAGIGSLNLNSIFPA